MAPAYDRSERATRRRGVGALGVVRGATEPQRL
jgi:hypothetical protein